MLHEIIVYVSADNRPEESALVERVSAITSRLAPGVEAQTSKRIPPGVRAELPAVLINDRPVGHRSGGIPPDWMIEASLAHALEPRHIAFLCVANAARSLLAECMARVLAPPGTMVSSAGSRPGEARPETVRVLEELGLDPKGLHPKGVDEIEVDSVQLVVTLCAEAECPVILRPTPRLHWPIADPAAVAGDEAARLEAFRAARDAIRERLYVLFHG